MGEKHTFIDYVVQKTKKEIKQELHDKIKIFVLDCIKNGIDDTKGILELDKKNLFKKAYKDKKGSAFNTACSARISAIKATYLKGSNGGKPDVNYPEIFDNMKVEVMDAIKERMLAVGKRHIDSVETDLKIKKELSALESGEYMDIIKPLLSQASAITQSTDFSIKNKKDMDVLKKVIPICIQVGRYLKEQIPSDIFNTIASITKAHDQAEAKNNMDATPEQSIVEGIAQIAELQPKRPDDIVINNTENADLQQVE
jgi:hypothetical protein